MTDNWDFYATRVDDQPASIFVDLGAESAAPVALLAHMAYVRLYMKHPRPDGLSSNDEYDALVGLEDAMEADLVGDDVVYVGRNTSNGCRDFYFYTSKPASWEVKVRQALVDFGGYEYDVGNRDDAEWSTYFNFLLPGEVDRQRIENRRVCESLERHGDKLVVAREIDHWIYFESPEALETCLAELEAMGFKMRAKHPNSQGKMPYGVQVWRSDIPSYDNIDDVTLPLLRAAASQKGDYDGWECAVET